MKLPLKLVRTICVSESKINPCIEKRNKRKGTITVKRTEMQAVEFLRPR